MSDQPLHAGSRKYHRTKSRLTKSGPCTLCLTHTKLTQDHCHRTGLLRDHLCRKCNMALGLFADNPALLRHAAAYLERHARLHAQYRDRV
jgi:hypothetical protein